MDAPLALYRRYRPDSFADVIGQDHVTGPISAALDNNRVHHAYLFSGPRGCGKTTSARILARALNCEKGPTSTPCGDCESCVELSRGGAGSIDVIEIDAASHGGVDDARELRERAFFAPMKARFKVYIIDEAHMVTPQGFNALLKLVEEPPGHVRFVFATTEPEKVIGTIRSRTHHYPFRLVPPKVLGDYLLEICRHEDVQIEPTVIQLVVRAGGGSVRDSLSVLDQLIGGSGPDGVTYALATALLGYTPDTLIDETIDALAADDGGTLFAVVDKVINAGQDPRRFAEDLLQRLRDLVIVSAVPDATSRGLLEVSTDQAARLAHQAAQFGRAELTRGADIVSEGLTEMRGATAPRLLLELMCARILLPGIDASVEGLGARLARLERRLSMIGDGTSPADGPPRFGTPPASAAASRPSAAVPGEASAPRPASQPASGPAPSPGTPSTTNARTDPPTWRAAPTAPDGSAPPAPVVSTTARSDPAALSLVDVRQLWPGVLDRVKSMRRYTWILLSQNAHVKDVADGVLTIGLVNAGARDSFLSSGADEILRQALIDELGVDWRVEAIIDGSPRSASVSDRPASPDRWRAPAPNTERAEPNAAPTPETGLASVASSVASPAASEPVTEEPADRTSVVEAAKQAIRTTRSGAPVRAADGAEDDVVSADDDVLDDATLTSRELLTRELGAQLIDDIRHDSS